MILTGKTSWLRIIGIHFIFQYKVSSCFSQGDIQLGCKASTRLQRPAKKDNFFGIGIVYHCSSNALLVIALCLSLWYRYLLNVSFYLSGIDISKCCTNVVKSIAYRPLLFVVKKMLFSEHLLEYKQRDFFFLVHCVIWADVLFGTWTKIGDLGWALSCCILSHKIRWDICVFFFQKKTFSLLNYCV